MRFKICAAIDKENTNDNFLITLHAGDSYSASRVVVVRERITRKKGALHMGKRRPSGDGMVRKRDDGRWEGRIVVGHKANGDPIFRHVYAKTQKALTEKLHQSIECYQDVELTEDSRMTLGEWLARGIQGRHDPVGHAGRLPQLYRKLHQAAAWRQTGFAHHDTGCAADVPAAEKRRARARGRRGQ